METALPDTWQALRTYPFYMLSPKTLACLPRIGSRIDHFLDGATTLGMARRSYKFWKRRNRNGVFGGCWQPWQVSPSSQEDTSTDVACACTDNWTMLSLPTTKIHLKLLKATHSMWNSHHHNMDSVVAFSNNLVQLVSLDSKSFCCEYHNLTLVCAVNRSFCGEHHNLTVVCAENRRFCG